MSGLRTVLAAWLLCVALPTVAVESLQGRIATITAEDWTLSGLTFSVGIEQPGNVAVLLAEVRIEALELVSAGLSFNNVVVNCGGVTISAALFACREAAFTIDLPVIGRQTFPGEASYQRDTGVTRFDLRGVPLAHGIAGVRGSATETSVDVTFTGADLRLTELVAIANSFVNSSPSSEPMPDAAGLSASGRANVNGAMQMRHGELTHISLAAGLDEASLSNETGTLVAEGVKAQLDIAADRGHGNWQFSLDVAADAGEAYAEPVYANLAENPVTFRTKGTASSDFAMIELSSFALEQGSLIEATGILGFARATDSAAANWSGTIELAASSVDAIYSGLLQVLLAGTVAGDMQTAGTVAGIVKLDESEVTATELTLSNVSLDDNQDRFALYEVNGTVRWPATGGGAAGKTPSVLSWESGSALNIPLGSGDLEANLGIDGFQLVRPLRIPTMGGAILVNRLVLENFGTDEARGLLDAELEPIELGQLTSAFDWPAFSGSLSGHLPLLQYDQGIVTLGGTLSASAFGGTLEFTNLRLEEPLGLVPRLYGDLRLRGLDLRQLTDTFSFGMIQGRLSGDVTGLEMIAWRPVAMDLHLYTPPNDPARRRISQRAVENLASVGGGGAAAALSSGFMKFFEEFSYNSIGIRCILEDGTCMMSGAGPAGESAYGQGYYIVRGSGLPRIDVVGYRHQVSWNSLVRQLASIAESGAPVID